MELLSLEGWLFILRLIHFLVGITWIGVLYYFNFIQTPFFATDLGGEARSAMMRGLVPNALWWFRWGAMFTFLSGWTLVITHMVTGGYGMDYYTLVFTGGLMGTLMWFKVWFVIWPIQRGLIANANATASGGQADEAAAARAPTAARASRTNTLFSIPMLFFMGSASHMAQLVSGSPDFRTYWIVMLVVLALVESNAFVSNPGQRPLGSVSGTITAGFVVTLVLFVAASFLL